MKFMIQMAGVLQILLAVLHVPIAIKLKWREDLKNTSPLTRQIFWVHSYFIVLVLLLVGIPCAAWPGMFFNKSQLGLTVALGLTIFWGCRLFTQFFVYSPEHYRGKKLETTVHWIVSALWIYLTATYGLLTFWQILA